ncbi:MAG: hypothetical protein H0V89_00920 [Deltaproteobacteria bacterium]|nr:hypothetical protein [Deltaproteobacteria bacterium]
MTGGCDEATVPLQPGEVSSATGFSAEEASAAFGVRTGAITLPDIAGSWDATIELREIGDVTENVAAQQGGEGCHPGESWLQIQGTWDVLVEGVLGVPRDLSSTNLRAFEDGTYEVTAHATFEPVDRKLCIGPSGRRGLPRYWMA